MAFEKLSDQIRQLIGENDQRQAAELLLRAFRDRNPTLFNIALVQQANIKKLADQNAAGILSPDEVNREQAKINVALLHLSDEHARLFEASVSRRVLPRWKRQHPQGVFKPPFFQHQPRAKGAGADAVVKGNHGWNDATTRPKKRRPVRAALK